MGVECASCGQIIPSGQLRCGSCGAVQANDSFDDYGGLTEVPPQKAAGDLPAGALRQTESYAAAGRPLEGGNGTGSTTAVARSDENPRKTGSHGDVSLESNGQRAPRESNAGGVSAGEADAALGVFDRVEDTASLEDPGALPSTEASAPASQRTPAYTNGPASTSSSQRITTVSTTQVPLPGTASSSSSQRIATLLHHDDDDAREPAVPRGTFASEVPERIATGDERELVRILPEVVPAKAETGAHKAVAAKPAASSTSQKLKTVRPAQKPPYLASEILREDLTPSEPGRKQINLTLQVAPALGALAVLSSGIDHLGTWISMVVLGALFTLTRFELSYHGLAMIVAGIGGTALAAASGARVAMGGGFDGPLLAAVTTLLPAALLFRSWYRAAYTARVLVSLALVLVVMWATWTSHRGLLALEFDWQSWVPALIWYLFCILGLLSLLAFMSEETTGGCDVWALGISLWYGLFACSRFALEEQGVQISNFQTLGLVEPALAAPTAVALAQLFSRIFSTAKLKS